MGYADESFSKRAERMGDDAEAAFGRFAEANGISYVKKGFNRSDLPDFWQLPAFVRQIPDFACSGKEKFFVECKGTGGSVLKLKHENIDSLRRWNNELLTWIFLYNDKKDTYAIMPFSKLEKIATEHPHPVERFSDNDKPYYVIPTRLFKWYKVPGERPPPKEDEDGTPTEGVQ